MPAPSHTPIRWRSLLLIALVCILCFGGSFTCTTGDDDDNFHGAVVTREKAPERHK